MTSPNPAPFSPRAAALLVVAGVVLFAALLWQLGGGLAPGRINNGEAHAGAKGLAGFAGLAQGLRGAGYEVALGRGKGDLTTPGVLVLTPPALAPGGDIDQIVTRHRRIGPVVVIAPKWLAGPLPQDDPSARPGWVSLSGTRLPGWRDFLDDVRVEIRSEGKGARRAATSLPAPAPVLPDGSQVEVGKGARLVLLAQAQGHGLAARYDETVTLPGEARGDEKQRYPLYLVFEPDLLDNYGLSHADNGLWAEAFFAQVAGGGPRRITFDLTLNGLGVQPDLLTLAFTPPYLSATLGLALAVVAALWRGLMRFGPVVDEGLAVPLGKAALLGNAAALVVRARRFHGLGGPYADAARGRLARALSLLSSRPHGRDAASVDAAIDRALGGRADFTATAAALAQARRAREVVELAQQLHAIERMLIP